MICRLRHIIYVVLFFLCVATNIKADKTYPFFISNQFQYPGGRLLANDNKPNSYFFIKQSWLANTETMVSWHGTSKSDLIGWNLGLERILDIYVDKNKILLCGIRNNSLFIQVYDFNLNIISSKILDSLDGQFESSTKIKKFFNNFIIMSYNKLWELEITNQEIVTNLLFTKVDDFEIEKQFILLIEKHDQFIVLKEQNKTTTSYRQIRLESAESNKIAVSGDYIFIKSFFSEINSTLIQVVSLNHFQVIYKNLFDVNYNLIDFDTENNSPVIYYSMVNRNQINVIKLLLAYSNKSEEITSLKETIYEPTKLKIINTQVYLITRNTLLRFNKNLKLNLLYSSQFGSNLGNDFNISLAGNNLIVASNNYSELLEIAENKYWFVYYIYHNLLKYIIPLILLIFSLIFFKLYHRQRKVFTELLNLPSANIFIILDTKGNVEYLSAKARELLMVDPAVNINVALPTLLSNTMFEPILNFYENSIKNPSYHSQKLTIINNKEAREYIFSISPYFAVSGTLNGYLINAFDITEQLERKKMANWAQLAHDMQTNLLTIKLNAEQMSCEQMSENYDRKKRILHQVNLLQKRVRDIVTIGRSTNLELVQTNTYELMSEAASEFDKSLFPNVEISVISDKIDLLCDKPKILRAIRNCIENGIKAMPDGNGRIDLSSWSEGKMICLSIKDNGKGMEEQTKKKFLEPYFSTSKDGSGFGIGTIIIQQAVELHNGKIEIKSKTGIGTEIIIKLPRIKKY